VAEVPAWVQRAGGRSLIVEAVKGGFEIHPVLDGAVLDEALVVAEADGVERAIEGLKWERAGEARDDTPWLNAWRHGKRTGVEVPGRDGEPATALAARVTRALAGDAPAGGGVVG
jgi:hypothetical protein